MRVTLVIASLAGGGAERVMASMANHWAAHEHEITLITLASAAADCQPLDTARIRRIALDLITRSRGGVQALRHNARRLVQLAVAIRSSRPDVVISFMADVNILTLGATWGEAIPVIVAERTNPMAHHISLFWRVLRRVIYRHASAVVVQTPEVHRWAASFVPPDRVHTIPNAVCAQQARVSRTATADRSDCVTDAGSVVVGLGRLTREKGFDLLLQAFAQCLARDPRWSLIIVGEGQERRTLEALAQQLGIAAAVRFPGHVPEPSAFLHQADLFVLPSRYEGFPNALLEAMACGVPVIATDCPSGPRHIVSHEVDGLLVAPESVGELSRAMLRLMTAPEERRRLGRRAVAVAERYSVEAVMQRWDDLLAHTVASVGRKGAGGHGRSVCEW